MSNIITFIGNSKFNNTKLKVDAQAEFFTKLRAFIRVIRYKYGGFNVHLSQAPC